MSKGVYRHCEFPLCRKRFFGRIKHEWLTPDAATLYPDRPGFCRMHFDRTYRHGDPSIVKRPRNALKGYR